jgi:hypothetical protein
VQVLPAMFSSQSKIRKAKGAQPDHLEEQVASVSLVCSISKKELLVEL